MDSDLNQKYSPDFKDRYQIELLLRELDVSDGPMNDSGVPSPPSAPSQPPQLSPAAWPPLPRGDCMISPWHSPCSGPGEGSGQV